MRMGVLGSGEVGRRLAAGLAGRGHDVVIGTRTPDKPELVEWAAEGGAGAGVRRAGYGEAAAHAELAVLATPWTGTEDALQAAGAERLAGKVVIDVTNPLDFSSGGPALSVGHTDSAGEQVQRWLPDARVVKCWNLIGNPLMIDPADGLAEPPTMWLAGDDDAARTQVANLLRDLGWEDVIELPGIEHARYLEPAAMLWIVSGQRLGRWDIGLRLLRGGA